MQYFLFLTIGIAHKTCLQEPNPPYRAALLYPEFVLQVVGACNMAVTSTIAWVADL